MKHELVEEDLGDARTGLPASHSPGQFLVSAVPPVFMMCMKYSGGG